MPITKFNIFHLASADPKWIFLTFLILNLTTNMFVRADSTYFQQYVNYSIEIRLDTTHRALHGNMLIHYSNNSDDTLKYIYFHLYPNAYKNRNTALVKQELKLGNSNIFFASDEERGFIDSLNFTTDNLSLKWQLDDEHIDVCKVELLSPLIPGDSIKINTPFYINLPSAKLSRLGHQSGAYYITQWYPKPAVYDRDGWHIQPYLQQGEYYSEFGDYSLKIKLPSGYQLASTGKVEKIDTINGLTEHSISIKNVHDFAWVASPKLIHKRKNVVIGNKKVDIHIYYYQENEKYWQFAFRNTELALKYFSEVFGEYEYDEMTLVDGKSIAGTDMEYPCLTIIGQPHSQYEFRNVIAHEVAHMWHYSALGFNERKHPWLDEGLATFSELIYHDYNNKGSEVIGNNDLLTGSDLLNQITGINTLTKRNGYALWYLVKMRLRQDQPPSLSSEEHNRSSYSSAAYIKSALAFDLLRSYLGDELFSSCFNLFYSKWRNKHPQPNDLIETFEICSGKDLSWFYDDLINSNDPIDLKLNIDKGRDTLNVSSENDMSIPYYYSQSTSNDTIISGFWMSKTENIEHDNLHNTRTSIYNPPLPDINPKDNILLNGKHRQRIKFKFITSPGVKADLKEIYYSPIAAYNEYNKLMAGISLHNYSLAPKHFEFSVTPLFDFKNIDVAGIGDLTKRWYPNSKSISEYNIKVRAARFAYDDNFSESIIQSSGKDPLIYNRINLTGELKFRPKEIISRKNSMLVISHSSVVRDIIEYTQIADDYVPERTQKHFGFQSLNWIYNNQRIIDPYGLNIGIENGDQYMKAKVEFKYTFSYPVQGKGVDIRIFGGKFIYNDQLNYNYNFRMDGWSGTDDYLFDDYYFGRSETEGFWNRQFLVKDGGFKTPTAVGQSNNWIAAINIYIDNPTPLPIKFFIDIGTYDGIKDVFEDLDNVIMFDGGVVFSMGNGAFEVYLPLFNSADIKKYHDTNDIKFSERVRFVFDIKKLSPIKARDKWNEF